MRDTYLEIAELFEMGLGGGACSVADLVDWRGAPSTHAGDGLSCQAAAGPGQEEGIMTWHTPLFPLGYVVFIVCIVIFCWAISRGPWVITWSSS